MSPVVDETAGDLPVKDVGMMRGGLMPTVPDTLRDVKSWKKHHVMRTKDPQRLFRFPREHLEDLCLRLQEENSVLKQHTRTQDQRLRSMSARLMRLRQTSPGSSAVKERDMEDTIQELEARVAMLESQKGVLQNKLSLAKQHIMDLGARTPYKFSKGKNLDGDGGMRRAAQTAPPRYGPTLEDTRAEMERFRSTMTEQVRVAELELTAQALRDSLREKEKEIEGTFREMRKQQADRHRITIRENVDLIRLQKQLSEKSAALRVTEEKFTNLQEAYENQLEETQRSMRESQGALLGKVEELTEQLKQERQKALELEGQLTNTTLSLQTLDKLQERISDLEGERDLIKRNYDTLLESTLSSQSNHDHQVEKEKEVLQTSEKLGENISGMEEMLLAEQEDRRRLEVEKEKLRQEKEILEEQMEQERELSLSMRDKQEQLEQEVLRYKEQVSALQDRLDSVSKEFDMSVEELSETLLQIKAFRMQQESKEGLRFLLADGKLEDSPGELVNIQASHAETVLELQKTRNLLLLEHQITKDLQEELSTVSQKVEREREESRRRIAEKDKLLSKRALQMNSLQAQLKELAYSPRNYKRTIPVQYTWPVGDQEVVQPIEDDMSFSQLKAGESLLEIHLKAATFTPAGLRIMGGIHPGADKGENIVSFCTYSLLDFEMHSTPLVSGSQPNYGFTSRYCLTVRDLGRLGGQGSRVRVELHQALGGVRFVTHGSGQMSLMGAIERRGERIGGHVNITGHEGEIVGVVDFWARLFPPAEPVATVAESGADWKTVRHRSPVQITLGWQDSIHEELHDYGGGIPNELVVMLERCVGLSARWPGLLPDAYLTYRLYDLPPHVSQTVKCTADPVFNDATSYPLAITTDVLQYLRSSSLWVYVFDDSDDQIPPPYLAKTPIPLRTLATGREIRGDYVLRDPAGGPRGMVRVMMKWKYPFQPPVDALLGQQGSRVDVEGRARESSEREERRREKDDASQRPIAKPRVKTWKPEPLQKEMKAWPRPPPTKQRSSQDVRAEQTTSVRPRSTDRKRSTKLYQRTLHLTPEPRLTTPSHLPATKYSERTSSRQSLTTASRVSSVSDARTQDISTVDQVSVVEGEEEDRSESAAAEDTEAPESSESSSSQSDIIVIPPKRKMRKGEKLRVEILSLTFEPSSHVAMDKSVQRVYVEYRLLGIPMETTETPMSLRKPTEGEEIHYNFTRVIYVDGSQSTPLRRYLYTMLEGADPNQGRLRFTVVSEPMDDNEECVDVGHAFLNLQELLLTGNDVIEQQLDIVSVDEDEVIGSLKVSLEAAKALTGIYQEFHTEDKTEKDEKTDEEEEEEDEVQRAVYKDLVLLVQKEKYLSLRQLRSKGEMSFEQDCLVEGGCLGQMHNGTEYKEVRQFQSAHHLVRFYFVTRIYSRYMKSILEDFRHGLKPDLVFVNSCVWDISRYNCSWVDDYKENLHRFFDELREALPEETLVVWNLTMPLGERIKGGFLVPEIEHKAPQLRYDVIEANFYSGTLADAYGMDVLDLHFQFRFSLHHRMKDGVHWNAVAHRKITSLLLQHAAEAWGVILPCPVTVYEHTEVAEEQPAYDSAPKHTDWRLSEIPYNGYRAEFFCDSLPTNYFNFENPLPQTCHFEATGTQRAALPPKPHHRNRYRETRNGFDNRPPHRFEPYQEYNHQHVMRSRHSRHHYAPYTQHRPFYYGYNGGYY